MHSIFGIPIEILQQVRINLLFYSLRLAHGGGETKEVSLRTCSRISKALAVEEETLALQYSQDSTAFVARRDRRRVILYPLLSR